MERIQNLNKMMLSEVLALINERPELLEEGNVFGYHKSSPLAAVIRCGFLEEYKFKLPPGIPPYTPSAQNAGLQSNDLLVYIKKGKLQYFLDESIDKVRRERLFIVLLETIHSSEADVMIAIKDQKLTDLFPNLTYELFAKNRYLPEKPQLSSKRESSVENTKVVEEKTKPTRKSSVRRSPKRTSSKAQTQ